MPDSRCCCCMAADRRVTPGATRPSISAEPARPLMRSTSAATAIANGWRTGITHSRISPMMRPWSPPHWRNAAASARSRSALRSAASPRCSRKGVPTAPGRVPYSPRSCWSTSRRASIATALPKSRASCASAPPAALPALPMPPVPSPPIWRIAPARVPPHLPHPPRPRSHEGLRKNLRLHPDGRWRWHWDPRVLKGERSFALDHRILEAALTDAAKAITIPALLVRGGSSELVHEAHVREFLELVPHADYIDVADA